MRGGSSRLLLGMNESSSRISAMHASSFSTAKCATPLRSLCVIAPPRSSLRDVLVGDGLDDVGAGDEHVARLLHHDDEVGDRRRIDRAAGARPHDGGDLRHDAGGERVAQEDVGVAAERQHAFLNARAARIVEADHRRAVRIARSMVLQIFAALVSDSDPPNTVKSCANA